MVVLTANLKGSDGNDYGVHWTLFRQAMIPDPNPGGWQSNQTWMAHTAISTPQGFDFAQRFARGGIGQAGVEVVNQSRFEAWMDDWLWQGVAESPFPATLSASTDNQRFTLELSASDNWVLQETTDTARKAIWGRRVITIVSPLSILRGRSGLTKNPSKLQVKVGSIVSGVPSLLRTIRRGGIGCRCT